MTNQTISVVIPHFNDAIGLRRALASLPEQAAGVDIVVVDDASPPDVQAEVANIVAEMRPQARLIIHSVNSGAAAARNTGADAAVGDIICLLDSDDLFLPAKLDWVRSCFADPKVQLVGHAYQDGAQRSRDNRGPLRLIRWWPWWLIVWKNPAVTPSVCFRNDPELRFDRRFRRFDDQFFLVEYARRHGPMMVADFVGCKVPKPLIGAGGLSGNFSAMLAAETVFLARVGCISPLALVVSAVGFVLLVPRIAFRLVRLARAAMR